MSLISLTIVARRRRGSCLARARARRRRSRGVLLLPKLYLEPFCGVVRVKIEVVPVVGVIDRLCRVVGADSVAGVTPRSQDA